MVSFGVRVSCGQLWTVRFMSICRTFTCFALVCIIIVLFVFFNELPCQFDRLKFIVMSFSSLFKFQAFFWKKNGVLITMKSYKHYLNCTYVSLPRFHWDTRHRSYLQMKWTFFVRLMLSCFGYWGYNNEIVGKCENRSCKSAEECGKNAFQTIFTVQPTLRHPIDQGLARPGLHNWMVFSVHRFSCVHNLCRADGMFAAHLIRQIWCSSDVYWVQTIEIVNKSECEKKEWKEKIENLLRYGVLVKATWRFQNAFAWFLCLWRSLCLIDIHFLLNYTIQSI